MNSSDLTSDQAAVLIAATQRYLRHLPVLDTYRNFLAKPSIEGLLVLKAIRTFEFAA